MPDRKRVDESLVRGNGAAQFAEPESAVLRQREVMPRASSCLAGERGQPCAQPLVDLRVVQERETMSGADVIAVLGLEQDPSAPAASGCSRDEHETVSNQTSQGKAWSLRCYGQ